MRTDIRGVAHVMPASVTTRSSTRAATVSSSRASAFIRDSVAKGEPILVVVSEEKIELLRRELGGDPDGVRFADMMQVGHNPARIIPAWRDFVAEHATSDRRFRGIGEPIWATRSASELVECARHEALLNLAFAEGSGWWLACPYDTRSLSPSVIAEAERNHPWVTRDGERARQRDLSRARRRGEAVRRATPGAVGSPSRAPLRRTTARASRTCACGSARRPPRSGSIRRGPET